MLFGGGAHLGAAILVEPGWRQVVAVETLQQALLIKSCWGGYAGAGLGGQAGGARRRGAEESLKGATRQGQKETTYK